MEDAIKILEQCKKILGMISVPNDLFDSVILPLVAVKSDISVAIEKLKEASCNADDTIQREDADSAEPDAGGRNGQQR